MRPGMRLWGTTASHGSRHARVMGQLFALVAAGMLSLLLAACGANQPASPPQPLGGSYTNAQFHFSLTYPAGWQANELPNPSPTAAAPTPLTVIVTRSGAAQANNGLVSNLTIAILDLHHPESLNSDLLKAVTTRATNPAYHAVTLAGHTAYATQPVQQAIYGTQQMETHSDYYLQTNGYEYHLSTDVLAGDGADDAIKSMLASFTLT